MQKEANPESDYGWEEQKPFSPRPLAARRRQRLLARGDGSVLSALSAARRSGAQ
jgi:hypothetical protein